MVFFSRASLRVLNFLIIIVSVLVVYFLYYKLVTFFANTLHGHYK